MQGVLGHPQNQEKRRGIYTAIVKKAIEGEKRKQFVKFHREEWKKYAKEKTLRHPAQMLIYRLSSKGEKGGANE